MGSIRIACRPEPLPYRQFRSHLHPTVGQRKALSSANACRDDRIQIIPSCSSPPLAAVKCMRSRPVHRSAGLAPQTSYLKLLPRTFASPTGSASSVGWMCNTPSSVKLLERLLVVVGLKLTVAPSAQCDLVFPEAEVEVIEVVIQSQDQFPLRNPGSSDAKRYIVQSKRSRRNTLFPSYGVALNAHAHIMNTGLYTIIILDKCFTYSM